MAYKIIFFGTSELAIPSVRALANDPRFEIVGAVTQPDRPAGRKQTLLAPPPIKQFILEEFSGASLPIMQPETLKDEAFRAWIETIGASCDAFVIVAYGKILPQWLLDLPKQGIINLHPSLLPRWRGPSPLQAAIAAGDTMTGISIMKIDAGMDHGPLLAQVEEPILPEETAGSLHDRLATLGGNILPGILADYLAGTIEPQEQDHSLATFCKILSRDDGKLHPTKTAQELDNLVRAFTPWPGTYISLQENRLKILTSRVGPADPSKTVGERFLSRDLPCLACSDGTILELTTVQPEGKKPMSGAAFISGYRKSFLTGV